MLHLPLASGNDQDMTNATANQEAFPFYQFAARACDTVSDEGESPTSEMSVTFFTCFVGETCLMSVIASNHMNTHQFTETALRSNARLIVDVWG